MREPTTIIGGIVVVVVAMVCATVAACLGHLSDEALAGLLLAAVTGGIGAGAHAAGVKQGQP